MSSRSHDTVAAWPISGLNRLSAKDQEYFSDAVTEDIITDLSKISGLFVVARNSTFTYKGRAEKMRLVAQELGVRYVLEGSVRRTGDKIRVTTQVVDALKGHHIWAERYDRDLKDVFAVQSEMARQVARTLAVTLKASGSERLFQKYTANVDAYDTFLQARKAVGLGGGFIWAHIALGGAYLAVGDAQGAVAAVSKALALDPGGDETNLFMGWKLRFAGDSARGVEHLQLARRLGPVDSDRDMAFMAQAQFMSRNHAEVARIYRERERKFPGVVNPNGSVIEAAAYTLLGQPEEAAAVVKALLDAQPGFNLSQWRYLNSWKSEENRNRLYEAARKAGIPEVAKRP